MATKQNKGQAQLGATFYPGGVDDFYMPEVISPAPQRVMPEVPENIQENLAHLELEATTTQRHDSMASISQKGADQPSFSPFPRLQTRPPNVPPSDEEKEAILSNARLPVLNSNDPEMQLTWAQDALTYVEISEQNEARSSAGRVTRSQTPRIEHQLRVDAINVVTFLADQHHPKAEFMRGMWLEFGRFGHRMDKKEAYMCYVRAAQRGYARAEYRMGMQFESSNDIAKAIKHYTLGIQGKDSASHYRLGMMTLLGQHGQRQDYRRGIELIRYAAETADENAPQGAYVYGMLQARELPQVNVPEQYLPYNINTARLDIEKAAYLGFSKAQSKMGAAYELCQLGCDFSPTLSLHYNALAARQGEPEADMAISKWFLCGYDGIFQKNEEMAFTYAQRAAQTGLATAEFAMGYFFEIGMYVPVDLKEAQVWYNKASDHGSKDAAARVDGISRSKTLSRKDHENVALATIRSQYGSQKGKRPERFRNPRQTLPAIADEAIKMPDPPAPRPNTAGFRPSSTVPYPTHIEPHEPSNRPPLSAQYPADNPFRTRPRPTNITSYHGADLRPNSAFGVSPNLRPKSSHLANERPFEGGYGDPGTSTTGPPRPYSTMEGTETGYTTGTPSQRAVSDHFHGYRQPSGGGNGPDSPNSMRPVDSITPQSELPLLNIGFSAPLDPSGADRRKRLQRSDNPNLGMRPPPSVLSHDAPLDRPSSKPPKIPHSQTLPNSFHTSSPHRQPGTAPDKLRSSSPHRQISSRPSSAGKASQHDNVNPTSAAKPLSTAVAPTPPPASTSVSAPPARPPGQGPKTFEEMGVPQGKAESDCIVM